MEERKTDFSEQGKKNRVRGRVFETRVREDLEKMGWVVDKWTNTVEFSKDQKGKIVPAKRKYNPFLKALAIGTGFPDFIAFRTYTLKGLDSHLMRGFCEKCQKTSFGQPLKEHFTTCEFCGELVGADSISNSKGDLEKTEVIGVEVKTNGYLDKKEKGMCFWLLENKIFSRILVAKKKKVKNKVEVEYKEFQHNKT